VWGSTNKRNADQVSLSINETLSQKSMQKKGKRAGAVVQVVKCLSEFNNNKKGKIPQEED
jgi:hypothetical protein